MQNYQGIFQKGRACMSHEWKGYILINLGQFEYEIPETPCKFKSFGVWKCKKNQKEYCVRVAYAITVWNKRWLHTFLIPHFSAIELNAGIHCFSQYFDWFPACGKPIRLKEIKAGKSTYSMQIWENTERECS